MGDTKSAVGAKKNGASGLRSIMGFREGTTILLILAIAGIMSFASPYFLTRENLTTTIQSFSIRLSRHSMTLVIISTAASTFRSHSLMR
jgi:predicted ABC-type sugar transport system permease subunit